MLYSLEKLVEKVILGIAASGSRDLGSESSEFQGMEIIGKPEDRSKVTDALGWLWDCTPTNKDIVRTHIGRIVCAEIADSCVFPVIRAFLLNVNLIRRNDVQQTANRILRASNYVKECVATGKYRLKRL